jgi:hypothetical protein
MIEKIRDTKKLLGIVGDAVHEAINELETAARQINECATDLTGDFEQRAVRDLGRSIARHARELRSDMAVLFKEPENEDQRNEV